MSSIILKSGIIVLKQFITQSGRDVINFFNKICIKWNYYNFIILAHTTCKIALKIRKVFHLGCVQYKFFRKHLSPQVKLR